MSGILTICNYSKTLESYQSLLMDMLHLMEKRGQDEEGYFISPHVMLAHRRSAVIDTHTGKQPMCYTFDQKTYRITYSGEIYNMLEIKNQLIQLGYTFQTMSDTEVILVSYIEYQESCLDLFEGSFAFVIDDGEKLFIARDQLGIQPLFYYVSNETIVIASELKCILKYIGKAVVDKQGIQELLGLGPSLTPGLTIYKDIYSLRPGYFMYFHDKCIQKCYWKLHDEKHNESLDETIVHVKELVTKSIQQQLIGDVPLSTMLSGGLDSSIITAISAQYIHPLQTYSITYEDQEKYFQAYNYQTSMDDNYIDEMIDRYHTQHQKITLKQEELLNALEESLIARDMPGMADIDSSFLLFCQNISKDYKIALSGECADEIFGGYPWFYKEELYNLPYFPWMRELDARIELFNDKMKALNIKDYIIQRYEESLKEINTDDRKKQLIYLNTQWFMQTLLTRANSQSMQSSLTIRIPFASTQILQYLYNMPSEYMFYQGEEKGILRLAFENFLPEDIAHRKKNPYPKTHSPIYTELIYQKIKESLNDSSNILYSFFDKDKLYEFVETKGTSFTSPWFGQLMMGPQLMAYFYQIYLWGKIYHIQLEL